MPYPGRTIQIFLPFGSPRGIKIAEITNRTVQAIYVPRNELLQAAARPEIQNVGIYYLFGHSDGALKPEVYIGEAENCFKRLKEHNYAKDFWEAAIVIVTNNPQNQFTKTDVKFLEHQSFQQAQATKRYKLSQTIPPLSFVPEWRQADLYDLFDTTKILLSTLGYPVFETIRKSESAEETSALYCQGKEAYGTGEYNDEGFVIFQGSYIRPAGTKSLESHIVRVRETLQHDGIIQEQEGRFKFQEDYACTSPSQAAAIILGRPANGWVDWKDDQGRTLDQLKRNMSS